ncbi:MAG TPA: hypothetical protein VLV15_00165, partial [Dongiaceae bacterium]|nr:hypothetical protein [Dongiaceae bacterium]
MVSVVAPAAVRSTLRTRVALLVALLIGEGGLLAARFNAQPLAEQTHAWWAVVLGEAGFVMPLVFATVTALLLLGGARLWSDLESAAALAPRGQPWPFLLAHLVGFVAFFRLTATVFEGGGGGAWAALWAVTGVSSLIAWGAAVLPLRALWRFSQRALAVLLAGAGVGALAVAAGQVTMDLWHPLGRATMWLVYQFIRPFTTAPLYEPEDFLIGTRAFPVIIAPKCSGYQGIGLVSVFLGVYLIAFRRTLRFP